MPITAAVTPGYTFSSSSKIDVANLNAAASPTVSISGSVGTLSLSDGSVTNAKVSSIAAIDASKLNLATIAGDVNFDSDTLVVDSSNNRVGIGTASPDATLHIADEGSTHPALLLGGATSSEGDLTWVEGETFNAGEWNLSSNTFTERLQVDASGNVGVGAASGGGKVHVQDGDIVVRTNSADAADNNLTFEKSRHATDGSHTVVADDDDLGSIQWKGSDGDSFELAASIMAECDGTPGDGDMPGRLVFSTTADGAATPTARATIDATGNFTLEGATSKMYFAGGTTNKIGIKDLGNNPGMFIGYGDTGLSFQGETNDSITPLHTTTEAVRDDAVFLGSSSSRFDSLYATDTTIDTSDAREKENIEDCDLGLENFVEKMRPVSFKRKSTPEKQRVRRHYGFIAQELEEVLGGKDMAALCIGPDGQGGERYMMRYHELIAPLYKAVQELSARVKELEAAA